MVNLSRKIGHGDGGKIRIRRMMMIIIEIALVMGKRVVEIKERTRMRMIIKTNVVVNRNPKMIPENGIKMRIMTTKTYIAAMKMRLKK